VLVSPGFGRGCVVSAGEEDPSGGAPLSAVARTPILYVQSPVQEGRTVRTKDRRREFRLSAEDDQLISEAAALSGVSFTGFVLDEALARAREIVDAHRTITLPEDAYRRFLEALDAPPERNPALVELAERATRFRRMS
jgi:uncharacterized protein (DUF1778 family)